LHYLNFKQTYGTVSLRPHYWHLCYQNCLWSTLCVLDYLLQYSVLLLNIIQHNMTDHRHILECEPRGNVIQFRCNIGIRVCIRCHAVDMWMYALWIFMCTVSATGPNTLRCCYLQRHDDLGPEQLICASNPVNQTRLTQWYNLCRINLLHPLLVSTCHLHINTICAYIFGVVIITLKLFVSELRYLQTFFLHILTNLKIAVYIWRLI